MEAEKKELSALREADQETIRKLERKVKSLKEENDSIVEDYYEQKEVLERQEKEIEEMKKRIEEMKEEKRIADEKMEEIRNAHEQLLAKKNDDMNALPASLIGKRGGSLSDGESDDDDDDDNDQLKVEVGLMIVEWVGCD